jgi:hypothetical protein
MSESEIPHLARIRCRHCGRKIRADVMVCPNCGRDPRALSLPPLWPTLILLGLGVALVVLIWYNARLILLAFEKEPTLVAAPPTVTSTWTPRLRVVVATETPNPTPTETTSPTVTPSATLTLTLTLVPSLTATRTVTRQRPTNTSTPTVELFGAPIPYIPEDGERLSGSRKQIVLGWVVPDNLPGRLWYRVQVDFLGRDNAPFTWCGFTQRGQLVFPQDYHDLSSPTDRTFRWNVQLTEPGNADPRESGCDLPFTPVSAPSATRTFFWY